MSISSIHAQTMKEMFAPRWETTEAYVSEITQLLGEDHLAFKATDSVMTAREHLVHICNHLNWVYGMLTGNSRHLEWSDSPTLSEIQEQQKKVFSAIASWTTSASEADLKETVFFRPAQREYSKNELLLLLLDHTRDHSGQLVVYLRLNTIEPPKYKGW